MGDREKFKEYLLREDVQIFHKMSELVKRGPSGDFLENWKTVRVFLFKEIRCRKLQGQQGLSCQEAQALERLRRMAKYKKNQSR